MERAAYTEGMPRQVLWGFTVVWVLGTAFSVLVTWLGFSGKLWDLGFPYWLIAFTVLVGVWQWFWVVPVLIRAKRRNRHGFYSGVLVGAISFSALNIVAWTFLFFKLRHFSLQ